MIQRIQSVYLLLAAIAIGLMMFLPLGQFLGGTESYSLRILGVYTTGEQPHLILPVMYMLYVAVLATLIPLITIFLYKRRLLQIRLCYVAAVFALGTAVIVGYYLYRAYSSVVVFDTHTVSISVVCAMPIIALILLWLAKRGIVKDESLIRSLDRLR